MITFTAEFIGVELFTIVHKGGSPSENRDLFPLKKTCRNFSPKNINAHISKNNAAGQKVSENICDQIN